jgi:hypothetical protein
MLKNQCTRSIAALFVLGSAQVALAEPAAHGGECSEPALAFIAGSDLHVSHALDVDYIGPDRISLFPSQPPPDDAFVPFEGHPRWGHVAMALIVDAPDDTPEYIPARSVPALRDYFVIYLEREAPAGSEFADYLFHSSAGVSAGYHLVHAEAEWRGPGSELEYFFSIVSIDQPIPDDFEDGAVPTGVNL